MSTTRFQTWGALAIAFLLWFGQPVRGAVTVIDTFLEPFDLSARGRTGQTDFITSDLVSLRQVGGNGNTEWYGVIEPGSGSFRYTVDVRGAPSRRDSFAFNYYTPLQSVNLLGYSAFRLEVVNVVGAGHLQVAVGGQEHERSQALAITGPGDYIYPFSYIVTGLPFDAIGSIQFWLIPDSADFSVTLSEIAVVPEPGALLLGALGLFAVAGVRRRAGPRLSPARLRSTLPSCPSPRPS